MAELNAAEKKKAAERAEAKKEEASQEKEIEAQKKAEADKLAAEEKAIKDKEAAEAKAKAKEEADHALIVVDVATYVGKVDSAKMNGVPRRLAGIRLMFEELGEENYIAKVAYKGTEAFVFKRK